MFLWPDAGDPAASRGAWAGGRAISQSWDAPGESKPDGQANHRNGTTPKTVLTDTRTVPLEIPRDRGGSFRPQSVSTGVWRLPQFDVHLLSLYARGVSAREIQAHLKQL